MNWLLQLDYKILELINQAGAHPLLDLFMPWVTDLNKQLWFQCAAIIFLIALFIYKFQKVFWIIFFGLALTIGLSDLVGGQVAKKMVNRERPFNNPEIQVEKRSHAGAKSFYSNHASNMFAFATYLSLFIPGAKYIAFSIAVIIGYSRIYNGVHYPSDVIAGALMGALIAYAVAQLIRVWLKKFKNKIQIQEKNP